jgi:hypothetical protein
VPVIDQDDVFGDSGHQIGLGDTTPSFFFSPKQLTASGWTWGAGPVLLLPTATDDLLGTEKWGIGPTALAIKQTKDGWTYGALVNHIWSVSIEPAALVAAQQSRSFYMPAGLRTRSRRA